MQSVEKKLIEQNIWQILAECSKIKFERLRLKYSKIEAGHQQYLKHHETKIYENTITYCKTKNKGFFLQFNLIIYAKFGPMNNTG